MLKEYSLQRLLITLICVFTFTSLTAQKVDSLLSLLNTQSDDTNKVKILIELTQAFSKQKDNAKALQYSAVAASLCDVIVTETKSTEKKEILKLKSRAEISTGLIHRKLGDYSKALENFNSALANSRKINDRVCMADVYHQIAVVYHFLADYAEALKYNCASLSVKKEINDKRGMSMSYNNIGILYERMSNYQAALSNHFASLKIKEVIKDTAGMGVSFNNIGVIHERLGNYAEALKNHFASLKVKEELKDTNGMGITYNNIGNVYIARNGFKEALSNFTKALKFNEAAKDIRSVANSYNNIASVYAKQNYYDEAIKYQQLSLKISEELKDKHAVALLYNNLSMMYLSKKDLKKSLEFSRISLRMREQIGDMHGVAGSCNLIGMLYMEESQFSQSRNWFLKGLIYALKIGHKEKIASIYSGLAKSDSALGRWNEALKEYKMHILYMDSLLSEENTKKIVEAQMQYDFDKKKSVSRAEQEKKDAIAEEELKNQKAQRNYFIAGFVLVFALAVIILRSFIVKKKANKELAQKNILIEQQKHEVEEKQKEVLDSIYYARRIQRALITNERYIEKNLLRLTKK